MTRQSNERIALDPPAAIMGLRSPKAHETEKQKRGLHIHAQPNKQFFKEIAVEVNK